MRLSKLIPTPVKELIRSRLRYHAISNALRPLKGAGTMTPQEISAFRDAWGRDDGFASDADFLGQLIKLLTAGPVLECGTGVTTLCENYAGLYRGFKTFALEQDPRYSEVSHWKLEAVRVLTSPLRDYGGYYWYDVRDSLPAHFALIVCDGPYIDRALGEPYYSSWRYGLMPWLRDNGKTFDKLLLDDVNDVRGPALLARWQQEFAVRIERIPSVHGECAVITP